MATNYSNYTEVPWYRKNAFALLLGALFSPPLLFILMTGEIYYQRKGELRTYSRLAKGFLILWSAATIVAMVGTFAGKSTLSGLFDMRPKEHQFMEQMQGVWKTDHATYACLWAQTDPRLICRTDEQGIMPLFEIRPNGELDTANHSLPVKYVMEKMRPEQVMAHAIVAQASALLGRESSIATQVKDQTQTQAQLIRNKNWAGLLQEVKPIPIDLYDDLLGSASPCFRKAIESGAQGGKLGLPDVSAVAESISTGKGSTTCPKLIEYLIAFPPRQVVAAMAPQMATASVTLRNVAKKPDEKFLPELIPDQSEALALSFVRQLNADEVSGMPPAMADEAARRISFAGIGPEFTAFWEAKLAADLRKVIERVRAEAAAAVAANSDKAATEQTSPKQAD